jgi:hypothetical protein
MNPFISTAWLWVIRGWGVGGDFSLGEEEDSWEPVERSSVYQISICAPPCEPVLPLIMFLQAFTGRLYS